MVETRVSSRYAKSLLRLAFEQGSLEAVHEDMQLVNTVCQQNRDFVLLLKSPIIRADKKLAVLNAVFGGKVGKLSLAFIELLTKKKREQFVDEIAYSFLNQYKTHKNILTAVVTTATELDDKIRKQVLELVQQTADQEVAVTEIVDKEILGGFVLRVGDNRIDSSLKSKLQKLTRTFNENPYISEL